MNRAREPQAYMFHGRAQRTLHLQVTRNSVVSGACIMESSLTAVLCGLGLGIGDWGTPSVHDNTHLGSVPIFSYFQEKVMVW